MSTPISTGDILVSNVICNVAAEQQTASLNRYWYCFSSSGGSLTFLQFATGLDTAWAALYKALLMNSATYNGTRVRRVFPNAGAVPNWEVQDTNAGPGTAGASGLPTQTCGLIQLHSGFIGKKGQGRQYVPFPADADNVDPGQPTTSYMTRLGNLAIELRSTQVVTVGGVTGTFVPILFNPVVPSTVYQLQSSVEPRAWATQKRRGAFGKTNRPPF